jgi:hypothetical protein
VGFVVLIGLVDFVVFEVEFAGLEVEFVKFVVSITVEFVVFVKLVEFVVLTKFVELVELLVAFDVITAEQVPLISE